MILVNNPYRRILSELNVGNHITKLVYDISTNSLYLKAMQALVLTVVCLSQHSNPFESVLKHVWSPQAASSAPIPLIQIGNSIVSFIPSNVIT